MKYSKSQDRALKLMRSGVNLYLTGKGGSGKSTIVKSFIATKSNAVVVAPTGTAAINIGGSTLHQFFGLSPHYRDPMSYFNRFATELEKNEDLRDEKIHKIASLIRNMDCLVIDEIGMVRSDNFSAMDLICRACMEEHDLAFGGIQVIAVGDLYQLPPIVNKERKWVPKGAEWFFTSPGFKVGNFKIVELQEGHRFEEGNEEADAFVEALNAIREGFPRISQIEFLNERVDVEPDKDAVVLCARKKRVKEINDKQLEELPGRFIAFDADYFGDEDAVSSFPVSKKIWLKRGAKVMLLTNNREGGWINGTIGTYVGKKGSLIFVKNGEKTLAVPKHTFELKEYVKKPDGEIELETVASMEQFPVQLSWAMTIHKAQGKSIKKVHLDLGEQGAFDHGQLYVGVSRCISYKGLTLEHPIRQEDIQCSPLVKEFMDEAI